MTTVLLTGAGGSAAANVLDSLRRSETRYRVVGADVSAVNLHLSRADERCLLPRANDPQYASALASTLRVHTVDVLHVQPDKEVLVVGRIRDELPAATFLPTQEALEIAADKVRFAEVMAAADVAIPESCDVPSLDGAVDVTDSLLARHDRVWLRARTGAGSRAALPVRSGDQARAWIAWWQSERGMRPDDFMVAELLPGREFAYQSVWQHGRLVAGQARERLEYLYGFLSPSGQSSTPAVARTIRDARIDELCQRAILALDSSPHGVYCVDLKEAADGSPRVTEINAGRFFTTANFFAAAGLNMPDLAIRAALGEHLPALGSSPLSPDLYWIRMVDMGFTLVRGADLDHWPTHGWHR